MHAFRFGISLALLGALHAHAAQPGDYRFATVHAGFNELDDADASVNFGAGAAVQGKVGMGRGVHGGLAVGRQSGHLRYEAEYQLGRFDIERLQLGTVNRTVDERGSYRALMLNAYRADQLGENLESFVGLGAGWGKIKLPLLRAGSSCDCFGPASKDGFAWQARGGLAYRLAGQGSVAVQVSRLVLPAPQRGGAPGVSYRKQAFPVLAVAYIQKF